MMQPVAPKSLRAPLPEPQIAPSTRTLITLINICEKYPKYSAVQAVITVALFLLKNSTYTEAQKDSFPNHRKHYTQRQIILDASAIMAYRQQPHAIQRLLTDHAPQYNLIVEDLAGCWIHDGRHYKKLNPVLNAHVKKQQAFLEIYWDYYHQLLEYKKSPSEANAKTLSREFDRTSSM